MSFQPSADSFGFRLSGFRCSWWHSRQANYAVAFKRRIFCENQDCKSFPFHGEPVRTYISYISGSRCAWWQKTTNRHIDTHTQHTHTHTHTHTYTHTHTHTHTHQTTTVTLAAHARRELIIITSAMQSINGASLKEPWVTQHCSHGSNSSTT